MKREQVVFFFVVLILSLQAYSLFSEKVPSSRVRSSTRALDLKEIGDVNAVKTSDRDWSSGRDVFLKPSADRPLVKLVVPAPVLPTPSVLLPPPIPNPGMQVSSYHLFVRPITLYGSIGSEDNISDSGDDFPADEFADEIIVDEDAEYRKEYDWIRLNALKTVYGRIVNENRYALKTGEEILFIEYDPAKGTQRFSQRPVLGEDYQAFGFAETLYNKIQIDTVAMKKKISAGNVLEGHEYIDWLLAQALAEPVAFEFALELSKEFAELVPDDASAWLKLADCYKAQLDLDAAFAVYAQMVGDPVFNDYASALESTGLDAGRFAHVSAARVGMGEILTILELHQDAFNQFKLADALGDGMAHAPMALGQSYYRQSSFEQARLFLQRAWNKQSNRSSVKGLENGLWLAKSMLAQGDWEAAYEQYVNLEKLASDAPEYQLASRCGQVATLYLEGKFASAQEQAEQAVLDYGPSAALMYMRAITTGANGGNAQDVVRDLNSVVESQPLQSADAHIALSFFYSVLGEEVLSAESLGLGLEQAPSHGYGNYLKAYLASKNGDLISANQIYKKLVEDNPDSAALMASYASGLYAQENYAEAHVAFSRIEDELSEQTKQAGSASSWANIYLRHGANLLSLSRFEESISALDYALSLDSSLYVARNVKALGLYSSNELELALAEFAYLQNTLRDDEEHSQFVYSDLWMRRMQEHDKLRLWEDDFSGKRLRPGWDLQNEARAGVAPRHSGEKLEIKGKHQEAARTLVSRSVPGLAFRKYQGEVVVNPGHSGSGGSFIALRNRSKTTWSFEVERNQEGQISYTETRGTRSDSKNINLVIGPGKPMEVSYSLNREEKQPVLTVMVNQEVIFQQEVVALRNPTGRMHCGYFAATALPLEVDVSLDNVQLVYAQL